MTDIRNGVNAGKTVTVHDTQITLNGWSGTGYTILDPESGAGAYMIGGGLDGGFTDYVFGITDFFGFLLLGLTSLSDATINIHTKFPLKYQFYTGAIGLLFTVITTVYSVFSDCSFKDGIIILIPLLSIIAIFALLAIVTGGAFAAIMIATMGSVLTNMMTNRLKSIAC